MSNDGLKGIMVILGLGLALVLIVALIFGMMLLFGTWTYSFNLLTQGLHNVASPSPTTNISYYADVTFGNLNASFQTLRWWAIVIIFSLFFGIIMCAFLVRKHPVYFVFYFIMILVVFVLSIFLSRGFEELHDSGTSLGTELTTAYAGSSWMMIYLPEIVVVISLLGAIILFVSYAYNQDDLGGVW